MKYIPYLHLSNAIEKRCPNGYHKNPETGQCEPKGQKGTASISTGCQEGFHQHAGYKNCHEIWKPHKPHTLSCNQHRLLGIPCRYKGEVLDENGRPVDKGISTREWLKQAKEKKEKKEKEQKDDKPKEEPIVGLPKHRMVNKTRNLLKDTVKSFVEFDTLCNDVNDALSSFDEKPEHVRKNIKDALSKIPWVHKVGLASKKLSNEDMVAIHTNLKKTLSEYPIGLLFLTQFKTDFKSDSRDKTGMSTMIWSNQYEGGDAKKPKMGAINICDGFINSSGEEEEYVEKTDPKTGKKSKWAWSVHGSTKYDCFSHEWGHVMLQAMCLLKHLHKSDEFADADSVQELEQYLKDTFKTELKDLVEELEIDSDELEVDIGDYTPVVTFDKREEYDLEELYSKVSPKGWTVIGTTANGKWAIAPLPNSHDIPSLRYNISKALGGDMKGLRKLMEYDKNIWYKTEIHPIKRELVIECERIYKELYGLDEVIPSDAYTGYGYLAVSGELKSWTYDNMDLQPMTGDHADERVAEAFHDVIVRGDKANSLSNIMVSAVQYYIYSSLNGIEESFSDFVRKNYTKEDIGELIVKQRYMNPQDIMCMRGDRI